MVALALVLLSSVVLAAGPGPLGPTAVEGLVGWYRADALTDQVEGGSPVLRWNDESGAGNDLQSDRGNGGALLELNAIRRLPAVWIGPRDTYSLGSGFVLKDHTIFLVYETSDPRRALLRDYDDDRIGILLRDGGSVDRLITSGEESCAYGRETIPADGFQIAVLSREKGALHAHVDGVDLSTGERCPDAIRVARLFQLRHGAREMGNGGGLRIAEMLFYDRALTAEARTGVTRYLSEKYGIAVAAPPAPAGAAAPSPAVRLGAATPWNANDTLRVAWTVTRAIEEPFRHDPTNEPSRLYATRDGVRARVSVALPLEAEAGGTRIRLLLLKNGSEYLPPQAISGTLAPGSREVLALEGQVSLGAGDYVEVVTAPDGGPGAVRVAPGEASFAAVLD